MSKQPVTNDFEYRDCRVRVKANPASTADGFWFPSYQIYDDSINDFMPHPNPVDGSADIDWVIELGIENAKKHIDIALDTKPRTTANA